jgi:protocatechuate 3,4-dioxygenase beta subunit
MKTRIIFFVLITVCVSFLLVAAIGIDILFEMHTFHAFVSGRITDMEGNPIPGALVKLYIRGSDGSERDFQSVTDESGRYSVRTPTLRYALDSSAAYRSMSISADGYVPVSVKEGIKKGTNAGREYEMTKAVSVSGRLVTTEGKPVPGATLTFIPIKHTDGSSKLSYSLVQARTDNDGSFSLNNVGPFEYRIYISGYGQKQCRQRPLNGDSFNFSDQDNRLGLDIRINDPLDYTISGHVRDSEGKPVADAFIWTISEDHNIWGACSDKEGAFSIIGLDGLGKDVFSVNLQGRTSQGKSFKMEITDVRLHADGLSFIVQ